MLQRYILILLAILLCTSCEKTDPLFCCTTDESCSLSGNPGAANKVYCPPRMICDDEGANGLETTCIVDPITSPCESPADCPNPARPFCIERSCVQCGVSTDCAVTTPVCNVETNACEICREEADCDDHTDTPHCLTTSGACVACLDNTNCVAAAPVCDQTSHACRGCRADSECASQVCIKGPGIDTGTCESEENVIYVATNGQATGTCMRLTPCNTFALGIAQVGGMRRTIKAAPTLPATPYMGAIILNGVNVRIIADGATTRPGIPDMNAVTVQGSSAVTIEGLTVTGATGTDAYGIACTGANATLNLMRSTVVGNVGEGGILLERCQFSLLNNVVAANGSPSSTSGGISVSRITTTGTHQIEFNTITGNTGLAGVAVGIQCSNGTATVPLTFSNNVIYGNTGTGVVQVGGAFCDWTYSDIEQTLVPPGVGNINANPLFVDPIMRNYHLMLASPARNVADTAATVTVDIDGDRRPQGIRSDMGADEVVE